MILQNQFHFMRTGSREICNPPPMDTDVDLVVLDKDYKLDAILIKNGYSCTTNCDDEYGDTDFETYRNGEVNIIVIHTAQQFMAWKVATAAAKQLNLMEKHQRIGLFQGVLYGNWGHNQRGDVN